MGTGAVHCRLKFVVSRGKQYLMHHLSRFRFGVWTEVRMQKAVDFKFIPCWVISQLPGGISTRLLEMDAKGNSIPSKSAYSIQPLVMENRVAMWQSWGGGVRGGGLGKWCLYGMRGLPRQTHSRSCGREGGKNAKNPALFAWVLHVTFWRGLELNFQLFHFQRIREGPHQVSLAGFSLLQRFTHISHAKQS